MHAVSAEATIETVAAAPQHGPMSALGALGVWVVLSGFGWAVIAGVVSLVG